MRKLKDHNREYGTNHIGDPSLELAGVLCDKCSNEMVYSDMWTLTSFPPQRHVHCPQCKYEGLKIV